MKTLIKNAEIVTMTGEKYKNGCILFDEKIQYVGEDKIFEADKIIDAEGKIVMPGKGRGTCYAYGNNGIDTRIAYKIKRLYESA